MMNPKKTALLTLFVSLAALPLGAVPSASPVVLWDINGVPRRPLETGADKAVVLIFISNDCPISNSYAPEINRLYTAYSPKKIAFYLISVDTGVTAAAVKQHAQQYALRCPNLLDPAHTLVKQVGATVTPEAAVYGSDGRLLYKGRIDDKYADFGKVRFAATAHDLQTALAAISAGRPVPHPVTKAVGCYI